MKVRLLQTLPGSNDGINLLQFQAGQEYDASTEPPCLPELAGIFLKYSLAEAADEEAAKLLATFQPSAAAAPAPENKDAQPALETGAGVPVDAAPAPSSDAPAADAASADAAPADSVDAPPADAPAADAAASNADATPGAATGKRKNSGSPAVDSSPPGHTEA